MTGHNIEPLNFTMQEFKDVFGMSSAEFGEKFGKSRNLVPQLIRCDYIRQPEEYAEYLDVLGEIAIVQFDKEYREAMAIEDENERELAFDIAYYKRTRAGKFIDHLRRQMDVAEEAMA